MPILMQDQPAVLQMEWWSEIKVQVRATVDGLNRLKNARAELVRLKAVCSAHKNSTTDDVATYDSVLDEIKIKFQKEIDKIV